MVLTIASVQVRPGDHWEIKGPNEIWVWHNDVISVIHSDADIMSLLIREWQERHRKIEIYENGSGI
jgi:hypothetical protein